MLAAPTAAFRSSTVRKVLRAANILGYNKTNHGLKNNIDRKKNLYNYYVSLRKFEVRFWYTVGTKVVRFRYEQNCKQAEISTPQSLRFSEGTFSVRTWAARCALTSTMANLYPNWNFKNYLSKKEEQDAFFTS